MNYHSLSYGYPMDTDEDDSYDADALDDISPGSNGNSKDYGSEKQPEVVITEINKISVKLGEVLVIRFPSSYSNSDVERIYKSFILALGPTSGARILMVPDDLDISKIEAAGQSSHPLY